MKFFYTKFLLASTAYMTGLTYVFYESVKEHYRRKENEIKYLQDKLHNSVI